MPTTNVCIETDCLQDDAPLTFVMGAGVPIILRRFLDALGAEIIERDLALGAVLDPRGEPVQDWVTFCGRRRLIIRGSKNVSYRECGDCGRHVYFAMGKRYLFPSPPNDATIFESDLFGLVVPGLLYERLQVREWRGLTIDELPVLSAPLDSLGELL